ncbi:chorion class high-cysteine HCB protein 12-like [Corvus moneduloides]|uniref:chorion class high-cysteine HCB protein 12-like n=1 Tax=Corvus moneduloides TaxID=1196302 RepID=UPI0013623706|nr:chorion class high-cysteine HCB protein 12-like [Corvus moneduloides]
MNGLGRAGRDARWAARGLIVSDSGAGAGPGCGCYGCGCYGCGCGCYRDGCYRDGCAGDSDRRQAGPAALSGAHRQRPPHPRRSETPIGRGAAHLARRLAAAGASAPPPTAGPRLTDRRGQGARGRGRGGCWWRCRGGTKAAGGARGCGRG